MTFLDVVDRVELAARVADEIARVAIESGTGLPRVHVSVSQDSDCNLTVSVRAEGVAIDELCRLLIVAARGEILEDAGLDESCVTFEIRPSGEA